MIPLILENTIPPIASGVVGYYTYRNAYKDGKAICDNYANNTYLYTLASVLVCWTFLVYFNKSSKLQKLSSNISESWTFTIISFLILGASGYGIRLIDPAHVIEKHVSWFLAVGLFSFITMSFYVDLKENLLFGVFATLSILYIGHILVSKYPDLITDEIRDKITYIIIGFFVLNFYIYYSKNISSEMKRNLLIFSIIVFVILITLILLSDLDKINENAEKCKKGEIKPDYINESMNLYIMAINLIIEFATMAHRKSKNKK